MRMRPETRMPKARRGWLSRKTWVPAGQRFTSASSARTAVSSASKAWKRGLEARMEAADWFMEEALKSVSEIRFRNRPHNVGGPAPADKSGAVHGPELATPVTPPDARPVGADGSLNRTKEAEMGIFDRNYDRDFGSRGGAGYHGGDRDLGDRMRQGWNRMKNTAHDAMDRDDDGYGYRGGAYGNNAWGRERTFG